MRARNWIIVVVLGLLVLGVARLRFDVEVLHLLPEELPVVRGLIDYQHYFADSRELIVTVSATDSVVTESAAQSLALHLRQSTNLVEDVFWQAPWLEHPLEGSELVAHAWLNQPPAHLRELARRLAPENLEPELARARERLATSMSPEEMGRLSYDPLGLLNVPTAGVDPAMQNRDLFASADGTFRILMVDGRPALRGYKEAKRWLQDIDQLTATWRTAHPEFKDVRLRRTGSPAFVAEIAGGMEHDMQQSVLGTLVLIAVLFWFAHRRWQPLLWLIAMLGLILLGTLAIGGLFYPALSVVSIGFAAILLGLAVDYGLVIYQEARDHSITEPAELRRQQAPAILWAAVTTAGAFAVLNFSGLPGLAQLGSLVALGIVLGAVVMLGLFPSLAVRYATRDKPYQPTPSGLLVSSRLRPIGLTLTVLLIVVAAVLLKSGVPTLDHSAGPLRPLNSESYGALEEIQSRLSHAANPLWVLVSGKNEAAVADRLIEVQRELNALQARDEIASFSSPITFWPQPENRRFNVPLGGQLAGFTNAIRAAAAAQGFSSNAVASAMTILQTWEAQAKHPESLWPTNRTARWADSKLSARTPDGWLALALITPRADLPMEQLAATLRNELPEHGVLVAGWDLLGESLLGLVERDLWRVLLPMVAVLLISLWLAFRRWSEVWLGLLSLGFSGLSLLAVMHVAGWSWNLLNLMALPLLLGAGIDYSIHFQLALRRHAGDVMAAWSTTGKALLLCGLTTAVGFGSLAWSGNAGLASLGKVCATGTACALVTAMLLLPAWWLTFVKTPPAARPAKPSQLYRAPLWRLAQTLIRALPLAFTRRLGRLAGRIYARLKPERHACVLQNLLPVCANSPEQAAKAADAVFANFGEKLVDLWRFESGADIQLLFTDFAGWEHYAKAKAEGHGVLLVTLHLGNWEFGGPLMTSKGERLLVLTLAEPGEGFTEMRQAARARWGIETLVVGENPFAFVEVIKQLNNGACVALLMDRPPEHNAVPATFFGRTISASIAAAELARASGCAIVPVTILRSGPGYIATALPAVTYDRRALGDRETRMALTQEILRAFEPVLRQHPDQWYHFVPVWPPPSA